MTTSLQYNYIYLLQEREFVNLNQNIYKIGKSKQENCKRINSYPKGSKLILQLLCDNCDLMETQLIALFTDKYVHKEAIGREYFEGEVESMINDIFLNRTIVNNSNNLITSTKTEINNLNDIYQKIKNEEKILSLNMKILQAKNKIEKKKLQMENEEQSKNKIEQQMKIEDSFLTWFNTNCIVDQYSNISLEKMVIDSNTNKERIKEIMKQKGHTYNKDLHTGLGKSEKGKYYKGGYEGIGFKYSI